MRISRLAESESTPLYGTRTMFDGLQMRRRPAATWAVLAAAFALIACRSTPITRKGPPQERMVSRVYPVPLNDLRARIQDRYIATHESLSGGFRVLKMTEQPPPGFSADWMATYVDPGGFLKP